ncbi:MAG TPA: hypothetical protein VH680_11215 [Gemmatimonadales bacterium]|jgi:hypothetical protein
MYRPAIAAALMLTLAACAPTTRATTFRQIAPKASGDQVEVFTETRPNRPFEEVGTIEVAASELSDGDYGDLIARARIKAAEMGADAILVTRDPRTRNTGLAYVPRQKNSGQLITATSRTIETPRIQVAAIAWKAARAD